tara:strand:+ start:2488 stop:3270 length:783 start_codon:yes stop_codon:yes gene_type:complete
MNAVLVDFQRTFSLTQLWLHLGWSEVARRYRRTVLGPFWHTLTLGIFILAMGTIWSSVLKTDFRSYAYHLTPSLIAWSFISATVVEGTGVFLNARQTVLTVNIPFPVLVFGLVWKLAITFAHHLLLIVVLMLVFQTTPNLNTLLLFPGLLFAYLNGLWMAFLIGIVCLRFRDVQMLVSVGMQIAQFVTPVFWPVALIAPKLVWVVQYNPLYHLLQLIREPLVGRAPDPENWVWCIGLFVGGSIVTLLIYGAVNRRMAYWY